MHSLTWASVSWSVCAKYKRSGPTIYCCLSNSASRRSNCSGVKIVRTRLLFNDDLLFDTWSVNGNHQWEWESQMRIFCLGVFYLNDMCWHGCPSNWNYIISTYMWREQSERGSTIQFYWQRFQLIFRASDSTFTIQVQLIHKFKFTQYSLQILIVSYVRLWPNQKRIITLNSNVISGGRWWDENMKTISAKNVSILSTKAS